MKPTEEEFDTAMAAVERIREEGDPEHVAKVVRHLEYKAELLERVYRHAVLYIHFGLNEHEHAELVRAIERIREFNAKQQGEEPETTGLG